MIRRLAYLLLLTAVVAACAKQGYPSGGPKDVAPPHPIAAQPANESRHFDKSKFFIEFDEYIVLKNANENVLVSPPLKHKPEYIAKGKGVLVKINDTLQPNTTYLFQFKEAVADFTEGNLLPSFEYVFSTGENFDTLMVEGTVSDAKSGKPWKEAVTVVAYKIENMRDASGIPGREHEGARWRAENDTMATNEQPDYMTRCDKNGAFAFHYIPQGQYRIVAFEDKNRNLRLDVDEAAAWDTLLHVSSSRDDSTRRGIPLRISAADYRKQRIVNSEFTDSGRISIVTALPLRQPSLGGTPTEWRLNDRRDTLRLWCLDAKADSARIILSDEGMQDTLKLRYRPKASANRSGRGGKTTHAKEPLTKALFSGTSAFHDDLRIAFTNPIATVSDSARAEVMKMKDSTLRYCTITMDSTGLTARLQTDLTSGEQYRIRLKDSLFTDIYGNTNDSLEVKLTPKDYGLLTLHIDNTTDSPLIVEVLDKRDTIVQQQRLESSGTLRFSHLAAGDYRLRAVIDIDGNGTWTTGDYRLQRQPEPTVLFGKTLQLREKWEMDERWTVEIPDYSPKPVRKISRL